MTTALDCPKCGAPLKFDPTPGEETVECPYCHETVIIPEDLRIPLPRVVVHKTPPPPPRSNRLGLGIGIAIVLAIAACVIFAIFDNSPNSSSSDSASNSAAIDTGSATSTSLSAEQGATATVEAQATNQALQPMLKLVRSWPASFTEPFTDNTHKWLTGDVRDSYITGNRSISAGVYTWKITTVQSASDFSIPTMPEQKDFYAGVDMKLVSMPDDPDADAGMVFRYTDADQTWYYFSVNDKGQYYLGWYNGSDWATLIPETDSDAIHVGQTNRLEVAAQGSQFIFVINGQMVDHFIDDNLKSGAVGVGVNLPQKGEKSTVEFSNLTVLSSPSKP